MELTEQNHDVKAKEIKDPRRGSADSRCLRGRRQAIHTVDDAGKTVSRRHNLHQ